MPATSTRLLYGNGWIEADEPEKIAGNIRKHFPVPPEMG
jgi:hypothetical protein